jgi:hypothetical protein
LGVPATLETGVPNVNLDFHDKELRFGYGAGNNFTCLENALKYNGDCSLANKDTLNPLNNEYEPCAHFVPEVWTTQLTRIGDMADQGIVEEPEGLGVVGQMNWWIPKFTAERDPTLLTYFGLAGEENRRKLAETFHRPTTWADYCNEESPTQCLEDDGVAQRAPLTDEEAGSYFDERYFTGYFRNTTENDCDTFPDSCTGHIADFPCGWSSFVEQQTWHLNIALRSSGDEPGCQGYTYSELIDIFAAANATKSDIIFQYWQPDMVHTTYAGTDTEFQAVGMPLPTLRCIENTVSSVERCDPDAEVRRGSPEGACGEPPYPLQKVYSSILFDITKGKGIPEAEENPAYDLFKAFSLTSLQLGDLYDRWASRGTTSGFDLRYATCEWMVENWELMESFIPRSFPRTAKENVVDFDDPLYLTVVIFAVVSGLAVVATAVLTFLWRERRPAIKNAQFGFLCILLCGLCLLLTGSIVSFLPPSNATCILDSWSVNLGYTLELIPLIVKVAAIQKLMTAARQMRRVNLNMESLYIYVVGVCVVLIIYLALWSILDTPEKAYYSGLTDKVTDDGAIIIELTPFCQSDSDLWRYLSAVWLCFLLIAATVLAVQTRKLKTDFGETETLGILVYSHFVFVALRVMTYTVDDKGEADARLYRSLIYSSNILSTIGIYFIPKFLHKENDRGIFDLRSSTAIPVSMRANFAAQASAAGLTPSFRLSNSQKSGSTSRIDGTTLDRKSVASIPGDRYDSTHAKIASIVEVPGQESEGDSADFVPCMDDVERSPLSTNDVTADNGDESEDSDEQKLLNSLNRRAGN